MSGQCVGNIDLPIAEGASLKATRAVVPDHDRRKLGVAWTPGLEETWVPGVHANCPCNEKAALLCRSLGPVPWADDARCGYEFRAAFSSLRKFVRRYGGQRWSHLQTANSYTGALRRRYLEAERSLREDGPLGPRDTKLSAFLKAEKIGLAKFHKPRMIFPRSPRFNLCLASWLKPLEHWLYGRLSLRALLGRRDWLSGRSTSRIIAKGLSPRQRANLIARKFKQFDDCIVFEVDGKGFEAHVSSEQIGLEHSVYAAAYGKAAALTSLLSCQRRMTGKTAHGWKFDRPGGRASGDFNTGLGNSLVMACATVSAVPRHVPFDMLVDGDNALVFVSAAHAGEVVPHFHRRVLDQCGHEMTLETPVHQLEAVRFGQSAPVYLGPRLGWTMVKDWRKVLSNICASHRWLSEPLFGRRWLNGVARCELSVSRGLPVLQQFALKLLDATEGVKPVGEDPFRDEFYVGAWFAERDDAIAVSPEARLSFEKAFGLTSEDQLLLEEGLSPTYGLERCGLEFPPFELKFQADPLLNNDGWRSL